MFIRFIHAAVVKVNGIYVCVIGEQLSDARFGYVLNGRIGISLNGDYGSVRPLESLESINKCEFNTIETNLYYLNKNFPKRKTR